MNWQEIFVYKPWRYFSSPTHKQRHRAVNQLKPHIFHLVQKTIKIENRFQMSSTNELGCMFIITKLAFHISIYTYYTIDSKFVSWELTYHRLVMYIPDSNMRLMATLSSYEIMPILRKIQWCKCFSRWICYVWLPVFSGIVKYNSAPSHKKKQNLLKDLLESRDFKNSLIENIL